MKNAHGFLAALVASAAALLAFPAAAQEPKIESKFADVNGIRMHYLVAGKGEPIILMHGYAQNSHMWRPAMKALAKGHLVVAPDLRGFGDTTKAESGYDKKSMAVDVHELARKLGIGKAAIAGHDIGLMVAYAYATISPMSWPAMPAFLMPSFFASSCTSTAIDFLS